MENSPIISVIVPVYNAEETLNRCIDSILSQTFREWELLLINDGSRDNSASICQNYAENDTRIRYIHKENGGVSSARNRGIDEAIGDYITFVDSDDWIEPDALEVLYKAAIEHQADIVIPRMKLSLYDCDGRHEKDQLNQDDYDLLVNQNTLSEYFEKLLRSWALYSTQGNLFRRSFLQDSGVRFNESVYVMEDFCFILDCLLKIQTIYHVNYVAYIFYVKDVQSYKNKRNYKKTAGGVMAVYTRLQNMAQTGLITLEPPYTDFLLSYWVQITDSALITEKRVADQIRALRKIGRTVQEQRLMDNYTKGSVDTHYRVLFKTASPMAYFLIRQGKSIKKRIRAIVHQWVRIA